MKNTKKRNGTIDFVRFLFSLLIVGYHGRLLTDVHDERLFIGSYIVVEFFFLTSAYLMCTKSETPEYSGVGQETKDYILHKISLIMPNLYVAWGIGFILLHIHSRSTIIYDAISSIWNLLLIDMAGFASDSYIVSASTWYLSAMFLAQAIVYPFMRKNKDTFFNLIAPLGFIFIMGFLFHQYEHITGNKEWVSVIYKGLLRAIGDTCGGCLIYIFSQKLTDINFTKFAKYSFTVIELGLYFAIAYYSIHHGNTRNDFVILLLLMIAITISFSNISYSENIFKGRLFKWLGEYSLSLYLSHIVLRTVIPFPDNFSYQRKLAIYYVASLLCGLLVMYLSKLMRYLYQKYSIQIKSIFICK